MRRLHKIFQLNALTIAVMYVVVGVLWILFSDQMVKLFVEDLETFSRYETFKGILYILVTGSLLFLLVKFSNHRIQKTQEKVDEALDSRF